MKQIFKTLSRLYDYKIISSFIFIFIIIHIPFLQKIPDIFQLTLIEAPQLYLLRLLSISIGFSSFILTTFLVIYNVLSRRLRRNSFDFILDNPWINLTFSLFISSLLFIILSIFTIQISSKNTTVTLMYLSSLVVFGNLFLQFPLIILSIRHSNSFHSIKRIIEKISIIDIDELNNPSYGADDAYLIEELEKNKLIQVKDIGVSSIKDDDWGMPQTILNDLFEKLIKNIDFNKVDKNQLDKYLSAYIFVSRHFQKVAINSKDEITIKVVLNNLFRIHFFFLDEKIENLRNNHVDSALQELLRDISDNSAYYSIQQYLLANLIKIIEEHIKSISYSDEELPTSEYVFKQVNFDYSQRNEIISNYWFYIKNELPNLLFDILKHAIETGNKNIYSHFDWQIHSLFSRISDSNNLTESQENELFNEYMFKAGRIVNFAIEHKVYKNIQPHSPIQIAGWIEKRKKYAFWSFYSFSNLLQKLNKTNNLDNIIVDDYFMIARSLASKKIDKEDKEKVFETIINGGFEIIKSNNTLPDTKKEMKKQLKWLNQFIEREVDLEEIKRKYLNKIVKL